MQPAAPVSRPDRTHRPHVVLVIPRGEAVRNFLYSDTLPTLAAGDARVTLLSVVAGEALAARVAPHADELVPLAEHRPPAWVSRLRVLTENAHDRWLWSEVAKNNWELRDRRAAARGKRLERGAVKAAARLLARRPALRALTRLEQELHWRLRPTRELDRLFERLRPDLVFNGSHIHGRAGELPTRVAARMGIPTAGFVFSWDNLTSRSRIFVPYDHYLVWHDRMAAQLREIYPEVAPERVHVTGTPQLDFHFREDLRLERRELARRIGIDPERPYVLYTAGIAHHFLEEHRHVALVIRLLDELGPRLEAALGSRPQLVVRTNVKDTSPEMLRLAEESGPDVVFPRALWDPETLTPRHEDLGFYSSLLAEAAMGINAASTVSLELLLFDKPVINLDFDPPGVELPWCLGYPRHIRFDHYRPVADSGAVMVARSEGDMREMLLRGLTLPTEGRERRREFLDEMFGGTLDGRAGRRVGEALLALARESRR